MGSGIGARVGYLTTLWSGLFSQGKHPQDGVMAGAIMTAPDKIPSAKKKVARRTTVSFSTVLLQRGIALADCQHVFDVPRINDTR